MLVAMRALRDWRPEKPGERELASAEAGCGSLWSRVTARCQPPGADILRCEPRPRSPGHQYSEGAGPDRAGAFYLVSASSVSRLSFLSPPILPPQLSGIRIYSQSMLILAILAIFSNFIYTIASQKLQEASMSVSPQLFYVIINIQLHVVLGFHFRRSGGICF